VGKTEKKKLKSVAEFFKSIENFDDSAIYAINITNKFRKSVRLSYARNLDLTLLEDVIYTLAQGKTLDTKHFPHILKGYRSRLFEKAMECHIRPDWLLIWTQDDAELTLMLVDTGTHSDLF
jgi:mRNA interferase YafQ